MPAPLSDITSEWPILIQKLETLKKEAVEKKEEPPKVSIPRTKRCYDLTKL